MIFLDLLCQLRPPAIFLSLCAHFYCSPLPGTPPALCADRDLAGGGEQEQDDGKGYNGGDRDFLDMI